MEKINIRRISTLVLLTISLIMSSCTSKFSQDEKITPADRGGQETVAAESGDTNGNVVTESPEVLPSDVTIVEVEEPVVKVPTEETPAGNSDNKGHWAAGELAALKELIAPYLASDSPNFVGKDNIGILSDYVFNESLLDLPIPAGHWEALFRSAFCFRQDEESNKLIKMYLTDFNDNGFISREAAVSGMMKLISLRYPISLGGSAEDFSRSDAVADFKECDGGFEYLARQAFCEGLTDQNVETNLAFRPKDHLTYAEAISMVYRVLGKYGLYTPAEKPKTDPDISSVITGIEWMQNECRDYYEKLNSSGDQTAKLNILAAAEQIIKPGDTSETWNQPMELERWQSALSGALGLDKSEVQAYTALGEAKTLTWEIAAISIFKLGFKLNAFDIRDATESEIESARSAIANFDSAMDISKFAQMYSSGIMHGMCENPGFSPKSEVSRGQALVLVKRIVERMP